MISHQTTRRGCSACAAFALTALGRLSDSSRATTGWSRNAGLRNKHWGNAARTGGALTDTLLMLGRVAEAADVAEQAVAYADRSGDWKMRSLRRADVADKR